MSEELLKRKDEDAISTLTLNSPNSLNACILTNWILGEIIKTDKKIRVIIILGEKHSVLGVM